MPKRPEIAIVVPMFNEAANLAAFGKAMTAECERLAAARKVAFRLIFIDDGSRDGSPEVASELGIGIPVRLIRLSRNFGKEAAISAGLAHVGEADAAIIMDADLQHPPAMIETFLSGWQDEGFDVVYAYKEGREGEGRGKGTLSGLYYRLINSGNRFDIPRDAGDFRLMSARAVAALNGLPENQRFMKGLYAWIGFRQKGVPYRPANRHAGSTTFSPWRLLSLSVDGIVAFTIAPLRYMTAIGALTFLAAMAYGTWIVVERLIWGEAIPGFASIVTLIAFFGSVQFMFLGILGEYIGKMLIEAKRRPQYIIADVTDVPAAE